jgi:diacylglycerol kinase (ATP)
VQRKFLVVVNPRSGRNRSAEVIRLVSKTLAGWPHVLLRWENEDDFAAVRKEISEGAFTDIVVAGGDGTVNRLAAEITGTTVTLGILPTGSGNGLARSLGISMRLEEAMQQILGGRYQLIDSGSVNGHPFFCTSGVGFDAHIGYLFANAQQRGLRNYVKLVAANLMKYKPLEYDIAIDGSLIRRHAFLITVANAGQYGNNFYIAPGASLQDGLFHLAILRPFRFYNMVGLLRKFITRKAHLSAHVETLTGRKIVITRNGKGPVHCDGEPLSEGPVLAYEMRPASLRVIAGTV